jgi:hypothetical protein
VTPEEVKSYTDAVKAGIISNRTAISKVMGNAMAASIDAEMEEIAKLANTTIATSVLNTAKAAVLAEYWPAIGAWTPIAQIVAVHSRISVVVASVA